MKSKRQWHLVERELPPEGVWVEATTPSGEVTTLKRVANLWFTDDVLYTYYTPVSWAYTE